MPFVNLSSHPSAQWNEEQRAEAQRLGKGEIIDIPFPFVPPEASAEDICKMAETIVADLLREFSRDELVVLVQGEYTLTVALVSLLRRKGVQVVAATSRRMVEIVDMQTTVRRFSFVQFRPYVLPGDQTESEKE